MSDWHFGIDYDMWLYPPVPWWEPDYDYELPEPIEAANIEGTLLVNADDAIEQVRGLQAENAKLRELLLDVADVLEEHTKLRELAERLRSAASDGTDNARDVLAENTKLRKLLLDVWNDAMQFDGFWDYVMDDGEIYNDDELPHYQQRMRDLGIEVD